MFCQYCGNNMGTGAFCAGCGARGGTPTTLTSLPEPYQFNWRAAAGLVAVFVLVVAFLFLGFRDAKPPAKTAANTASGAGAGWLTCGTPEIPTCGPPAEDRPIIPVTPVLNPHTETLLSGQVTVPHGSLWSVPFTIDPSVMHDVTVNGRFSAAGGSGNDVEVYVVDADSLENIRNGHASRVFYNSRRVTVGTINMPLHAAGTYYLVFNNRFAVFSNKYVSGDIQLNYKTTRL